MQTRQLLPIKEIVQFPQCSAIGSEVESLRVCEYLPADYKELRVLKISGKPLEGQTVKLPKFEFFSMMIVLSGNAKATFKSENSETA